MQKQIRVTNKKKNKKTFTKKIKKTNKNKRNKPANYETKQTRSGQRQQLFFVAEPFRNRRE